MIFIAFLQISVIGNERLSLAPVSSSGYPHKHKNIPWITSQLGVSQGLFQNLIWGQNYRYCLSLSLTNEVL